MTMRHLQPMWTNTKYLMACFITLISLGACGGGDSADNTGGGEKNLPPQEPVARGDWKNTEYLAQFQRDDISQSVNRLGPEVPTSSFKYGVSLYRITYTTTDGEGELINASGVIALPDKNPQLASPLLSFQHGTIYYDAEAPSNDRTAGAPPTLLASLGYITVAADYVGYGVSKGTPHPYLLKDPSTAAIIDLLQATRFWLNRRNITTNQQLFLTGYSQGGYVTMAAHQALEALDDGSLQVTASLPAAGPYNMVATLDELTSQLSFRQRQQALLTTHYAATTAERRLPPSIAESLAGFLVDQLVPNDSDIVFSDHVIYEYLRTDGEATAYHNVHDWKANAPIRLHHGKDDTVVPFINATDALTAMQAQGSADIALNECVVTPVADHETCIAPYGFFLSEYFGGIAQGL